MGASGLGSRAGRISARPWHRGRHCNGAAQKGQELGRPPMHRGWGDPKPANAPSAWDHACNTQTQHTPSTRNADLDKAHADPSTTAGKGRTPTHGEYTPEQSSSGGDGNVRGSEEVRTSASGPQTRRSPPQKSRSTFTSIFTRDHRLGGGLDGPREFGPAHTSRSRLEGLFPLLFDLGAEGGMGGTRGGIGGTEGEGRGAWGLGGEGRGDLGPLL